MRTTMGRRAYASDGSLTEEECKELDSYLVIEYLMELVKLEARRKLKQFDS
jgi:hypothetical protein